jgi:hypothetical protein
MVCCPCHSHQEDAESRAWRMARLDAARQGCDCTHVLISLPGQLSIVRSVVALDDQRPEPGPVVPYVLSSRWLTALSRDRQALLPGLSPHLGLSSIGLDSVVLRC